MCWILLIFFHFIKQFHLFCQVYFILLLFNTFLNTFHRFSFFLPTFRSLLQGDSFTRAKNFKSIFHLPWCRCDTSNSMSLPSWIVCVKISNFNHRIPRIHWNSTINWLRQTSRSNSEVLFYAILVWLKDLINDPSMIVKNHIGPGLNFL